MIAIAASPVPTHLPALELRVPLPQALGYGSAWCPRMHSLVNAMIEKGVEAEVVGPAGLEPAAYYPKSLVVGVLGSPAPAARADYHK